MDNNTSTEKKTLILPTPINPFPAVENYIVALGCHDDLVDVIQIMLRVLKIYYDNFGNIPIGGMYDLATENAIKTFQKANGMVVNGCVNIHTWNRLAEEYNTAVWENQ